jgi:hypothetical protein
MTAYTSTQSGDWSDTATWGGSGPPGDGDSATISIGHVVEIDGDVTLGTNPAEQSTIDLDIIGTLKWKDSPTGDWTFTMKGNTFIHTGGLLEIGRAASPIPATRTATWYTPLGATTVWRIYGPGTLRTYGAAAYHMGDADKQRTTLAAAVTAGSDKTIQFSDAVDYEVGDKVWIAKGGRLDQEMWTDGGSATGNWGVEKVTLKTKSNATTYTADLTYDHEANDMAFSVERNVIFECADTMILQFYYSTMADGDWVVDVNWTRVSPQRAGWVFYTYYCLITDNFIIKNTTIETDATARASGVYFARYTIVDMQNKEIDNLHMGGLETGLYIGQYATSDGGRATMGKITCFSTYRGMYINYQVVVDSLWYCAIGSLPDSNYAHTCYAIGCFHFKEIKSHSSAGIYISRRPLERSGPQRIDGGELYHCLNYAIRFYDIRQRKYEIRNLKVADTRQHAIEAYSSDSDNWIFENCSFDNCARFAVGNYGAIMTQPFATGTGSAGDFVFRNCTFGTDVRNGVNIRLDYSGVEYSPNRILLEKCVIKKHEYAGAVPDYTYWPEILHWVTGDWIDGWDSQEKWNSDRTLEFVDCQILNDSDVDQWPVVFPNNDRLAIVGGGAFVLDEGTVVIDNTVALKIQPLATFGRNCVNRHVPIKIPVEASDVLTVKLSLRKDTTMPAGRRPAIHLRAPGAAETVSEMTDAINTWEELTVSRTAVIKGFAEFWITAGCNEQALVDDWLKPAVRGTRNVYADKLVVEKT